MGLPVLLDDALQLLVGPQQVLVHLVHLGRQVLNLLVRFIDQFARFLDFLLPLDGSLGQLVQPVVDHLIVLSPSLHGLQLDLRGLIPVFLPIHPVGVLATTLVVQEQGPGVGEGLVVLAGHARERGYIARPLDHFLQFFGLLTQLINDLQLDALGIFLSYH